MGDRWASGGVPLGLIRLAAVSTFDLDAWSTRRRPAPPHGCRLRWTPNALAAHIVRGRTWFKAGARLAARLMSRARTTYEADLRRRPLSYDLPASPSARLLFPQRHGSSFVAREAGSRVRDMLAHLPAGARATSEVRALTRRTT
jgi:hypothetical protein